jgi:hypothetical protein
MSSVDPILQDLQDTDQTLHRLEGDGARRRDDDVTRINREAIARRRRHLERRLEVALKFAQTDLLEYRIQQGQRQSCSIRALATSVLLLQDIVTAAFDAVSDAPKLRYAPSFTNSDRSSLECSVLSTGPVAVVSLSIPNDKLLGMESDLDIAFDVVFRLLEVQTARDLRDIARRVGIAPIARVHAWAANSAKLGLATSLTWTKAILPRRTVEVPSRRAELLENLIGFTQDEFVDDVTTSCRLVGIDEAAYRFRLVAPDGSEIAGRLADEFARGRKWTINGWYVAALTRHREINYATGEETVQSTLTDLTSID